MREAIIRVDGHPHPKINSGCPMYVSRVGMQSGWNGRDFDITTNKLHARTFRLETAARVLRELVPTAYQLSICDAPKAQGSLV